jgi:hypothetical protein
MSLFRAAFTLLLLSAAACAANDVTVVVDMTAEGRQAVHPTPQHPVYYSPVLRGYQAIGSVVAGEKPPSPHDVVHVAAAELAKQGYRVIDSAHPTADIVLDFTWGYLNPTADMANGLYYNQGQAYALVLGNTIYQTMQLESFNHQQFMDAANDTRYFVILTAYDYASYAREHKRVVLWEAKMSIPTTGAFFDDVLTSLVQAGGPHFGRETLGHPMLEPAFPSKGRVDVVTPTVKNYFEASH